MNLKFIKREMRGSLHKESSRKRLSNCPSKWIAASVAGLLAQIFSAGKIGK
jgi:hypothetical protein